MKAFVALVRREQIEHRGAFLIAPLALVAILFGATVLAFTVGRVDARFSGAMMNLAPLRVFAIGFLGVGFAWALYLIATLFFYCADGFAADRRNNAMLFWKSMPVSDLRILYAKLAATLTIFPATIYVVSLLSSALLMGVAVVTSNISTGNGLAMLGNIFDIYVQVAGSTLLALVLGLLWYVPYMALVGALATVVGRWAIPLSLLLPSLVSLLEWVTLGGLSPFHTHVWNYLADRSDFKLADGYLENWFHAEGTFSMVDFGNDLLARTDWTQMAIGWLFAAVVIYLASEYRRRYNDN
ncbi:hypothetical protein PSQ90_06840 [Devosia rhodophyticola]|uniref:ABC transporter permease n=1 Tax=Devosia rhodophyticola TaxID=3026423 RepID=A0ABY7Z0H9_9HYPH|nr:hypothetical protein [Devosia rhodophyticola]WDR07143.1 hypothetical protein PSQ90_06840 [Devosia rhodophyticola]